MTEDRLTYLLNEAADLAPSAELRVRVADLRPQPRRLPWFALSGATAALAVAGLVLAPRESAAALLRRAATNASARIVSYAYSDGTWHLQSRSIVAPGWRRLDYPNGTIRLDAPNGHYERARPGDPVFLSATTKSTNDGPTLADHLRFLQELGRTVTVVAGPRRTEGERTVQDVTITMNARRERETVTLDVRSELVVGFLTEQRLAQGWTPAFRSDIVYPGPLSGSAEFWRGIDRSAVLSAKGLADAWGRRLSAVRETLRLSDGGLMSVRELRTLPSGDVLMLYTGPTGLRVRLSGEDGTAFDRVPFNPNDGHATPHDHAPIRVEGEPLRGLWFVPRKDGAHVPGRVRLEVVGRRSDEYDPRLEIVAVDPNEKVRVTGGGTFWLNPVREPAARPAWADAIDDSALRSDAQGRRDEARMVARYDRWLDAEGRSVEGTFALDPEPDAWAGDGPPAKGLRRDPEAAAKAAEAFRTMMAHAEAQGAPINPSLVETWLGRFEREARGERP